MLDKVLLNLPVFRRRSAPLVEVDHWNRIEAQASLGQRLFWLNHPRIAHHYYRKALIDGVPWQSWVSKALGHPAEHALELGCGNGAAIADLWRMGVAQRITGMDLDASRFTVGRELSHSTSGKVGFIPADVNTVELDEGAYDLIYAVQSFHHFENLEHVMLQCRRALKPHGFFVLDEYVGPARFQWTPEQLTLTSQLLALMPRNLRIYSHGMEKLAEGRSSVEDVIRVCPSEAIRSDEIVPLFRKYFRQVHHRNLGGTIQHILYSGIVHNFPDNDPAVDHLIDCVDGLESTFIQHGIIESDFVLLVGRA